MRKWMLISWVSHWMRMIQLWLFLKTPSTSNILSSEFKEEQTNKRSCESFYWFLKVFRMFLRADLRFFISSNVDIFTHGRQVARIFHGISSPCVCDTQNGMLFFFVHCRSEFLIFWIFFSFLLTSGGLVRIGGSTETLISMM
jgi:hypothetical protein